MISSGRVAGPHTLGRSPLTPAGAHGAGAFGTLLAAAGTTAQKAHRLDQADGPATAALVTPPTCGAGACRLSR